MITYQPGYCPDSTSVYADGRYLASVFADTSIYPNDGLAVELWPIGGRVNVHIIMGSEFDNGDDALHLYAKAGQLRQTLEALARVSVRPF